MRGLVLIIALLPALAVGQSLVKPVDKAIGPAGASTQTANSAAGNIPTAATDGVSLDGQCRVLITVSAASGQTLSGGGTLVFWYYDATLARWAVNVEGTNPPMTSASGSRDSTVFVRRTFPAGRFYVEADTVTSSGGALTVRVRTVSCASSGG
jgi:hypothetical protein